MNEKKKSHTKVSHIKHNQWKIQHYLSSESVMSIEEKKFMFLCRVKDIDIRGNRKWKYQDISCISCQNTEIIESQEQYFKLL